MFKCNLQRVVIGNVDNGLLVIRSLIEMIVGLNIQAQTTDFHTDNSD